MQQGAKHEVRGTKDRSELRVRLKDRMEDGLFPEKWAQPKGNLAKYHLAV